MGSRVVAVGAEREHIKTKMSKNIDTLFDAVGEFVRDEEDLTPQNTSKSSRTCEYVKQIELASDLFILKPNLVVRAYKNKGPLGLFHCFITKSMI